MSDDEKVIFDQSFSKMQKARYTEGFREGLSSGKEMTFQKGFDRGYSSGFQAGYALGLHNGVLRCLKSEVNRLHDSVKDQLHSVVEKDKANRGLCQLCSESDSQNVSSSENEGTKEMSKIVENQEKIIRDEITHMMTEDYSSILNSIGIHSLFNNHLSG